MRCDVVEELVLRNKRLERGNVRFRCLNLLADALPDADVVFSRDCLVHLSFDDIDRALRTICATRAAFLITTTFPARDVNQDIPTGRWRPLNLQIPPFSLPPPLRLLNEQCTEGGGKYADKSLGVWRVEDVRASARLEDE